MVTGLIQLVTSSLFAQSSLSQTELQRLPPVENLTAPDWLKPDGEIPGDEKKKLWSGSLEVGVNGSEGNSTNFNLHTGFDVDRQTAAGVLEIDFDYTKVTSSNVKIEHHALLDIEHKWLSETRFSCFVHLAYDYDEFKSFDSRISANAGAAYHLIDTAVTELLTRLGAGFSREIGGPVNDIVPEAVLGLQIKRQLSDRQQLQAEFEYLPDWSRLTNFRLETDVGWEILLDEQRQLSLKFELNDRYDNTPIGLRANDLTYAVLVLWKL